MKRYFLSPLTAILTFLLGFYLTLLAVSPTACPPDFKITHFAEISQQRKFNGELEVKYLDSSEQQFGTLGRFLATNNSPEIVYYSGYNKDNNVSNRIRQNGELEPLKLICGTGLEQQRLMPGETAIFPVYEPYNSLPYEVSFDFSVGADKAKKTVWVKVDK